MKYNKFLMVLALCVGISANTSRASDTLSRYGAAAWNYGPGAVYKGLKYAPTAAYRGLKYVAGGLGGSAIRGSSYIWNRVNSWSTTTQVSVLSAIVLALLAHGYYNKDEIKKLFYGVVENAPEPNQPTKAGIQSFGETGGSATVTGQQPQPQQEIVSLGNKALIDKYYNEYDKELKEIAYNDRQARIE